jgi:hypothetical protein
MLVSRPWLRDVKVYHDYGNNTIIIQGIGIVRTIPITKKLEAATKMLICYDFHFGIFDEEEDLMFAIELGLFSIGTIVVLRLVWSDQLVKLITLAGMNIVE